MRDRRVDVELVELALDEVDGVARAEQAEGDAPRSPLLVALGGGQARGLPGGVLVLERARQPAELGEGERRHPPPHLEGGAVASGEAELRGAFERPVEGGVPAAAGGESEPGGGVGEVEVEPVGVDVEAVGEAAEQEGGGRAERGEPEPLDVGRAQLEAELVDDRVGPGADL